MRAPRRPVETSIADILRGVKREKFRDALGRGFVLERPDGIDDETWWKLRFQLHDRARRPSELWIALRAWAAYCVAEGREPPADWRPDVRAMAGDDVWRVVWTSDHVDLAADWWAQRSRSSPAASGSP